MPESRIPESQISVTAPPGQAESATPTAASELRDLLVASGATAGSPTDDVVFEADNSDARVDWAVTIPSLLIAFAVVLWGILAPSSFASVADSALGGLLHGFGWAFVLFGTVFVAFVLMLLRGVQNFIKDMRGEKTCRENAADHGATGV